MQNKTKLIGFFRIRKTLFISLILKTKETRQFFTKHLVPADAVVFPTAARQPRLPFDAIYERDTITSIYTLIVFTCVLSFFSYPFLINALADL